MVVIGTCSLCNGAVCSPLAWLGVVPPVPRCVSCHATAARPHGPVIPMTPAPPSDKPQHPVTPFSIPLEAFPWRS